MAYDTPSLFESLDADQTQQRVASRRALAIADTRIASTMGQFLRGATSVEEFAERLGLVQEDFDWLITSAAEEVGYDQPELLKEAITASYREAVGPNDFLDPNAQAGAAPVGQQSIAPAVTPSMGPGINPLPVNPAAGVDPQAGAPGIPGMDPNNLEQQIAQPQQPIMAKWQVVAYDPALEAGPGAGDMGPFAQPGYQPDNYAVCPGCGADHADPNGVCPNCGQSSYAAPPQQGQQQFHARWQVVTEGNTDLGGPSPKIDKSHKAPSPKDLADDDSGLWPTKHKDITEVIERKNRSEEGHEPKEIGEKTTEQVDLPAAKGDDAGFAEGGVTKQDGPGTWHGKDGQADPVTNEKQAGYGDPSDDLYRGNSAPGEEEANYQRYLEWAAQDQAQNPQYWNQNSEAIPADYGMEYQDEQAPPPVQPQQQQSKPPFHSDDIPF